MPVSYLGADFSLFFSREKNRLEETPVRMM